MWENSARVKNLFWPGWNSFDSACGCVRVRVSEGLAASGICMLVKIGVAFGWPRRGRGGGGTTHTLVTELEGGFTSS